MLETDGRLLVGIPAFAAIWDRLPRYRWLATISRLPILRRLLPWIYEPIAFCLYHWGQTASPAPKLCQRLIRQSSSDGTNKQAFNRRDQRRIVGAN